MRQLLNFITGFTSDATVSLLIWCAFACAAALAIYISKLRSLKQVAILLIPVAVIIIYATSFNVAVERIHLVKYGILGFLVARSNISSASFQGLLFKVTLVALVTASLDETVQYFLPYRVGDLRDVWFGVVGAVWGGIFPPLISYLTKLPSKP